MTQLIEQNPIVSSEELIELFEANQGQLPTETQTVTIKTRNGGSIVWNRKSLERMGVVSPDICIEEPPGFLLKQKDDLWGYEWYSDYYQRNFPVEEWHRSRPAALRAAWNAYDDDMRGAEIRRTLELLMAKYSLGNILEIMAHVVESGPNGQTALSQHLSVAELIARGIDPTF